MLSEEGSPEATQNSPLPIVVARQNQKQTPKTVVFSFSVLWFKWQLLSLLKETLGTFPINDAVHISSGEC